MPQNVTERAVQILHPARLAVEVGVQTDCHDPAALLSLGIEHIEGIADHSLEFFAFGMVAVHNRIVNLHGVRHAHQISMRGSDRHGLIVVVVVSDVSDAMLGRDIGGPKCSRDRGSEPAVELRPVGLAQDAHAVANDVPLFILGKVPQVPRIVEAVAEVVALTRLHGFPDVWIVFDDAEVK